MGRAALLRVLAARNAAGRPLLAACMTAGQGGATTSPTPPTPAPPQPRAASAAAAAPRRPQPSSSSWHQALHACTTTTDRRAFASAAAASPARAEEAPPAAAASATSPANTDGSGILVSFPLAQTGEGISECELVRWHVAPGDAIEEFQPLCEVQSDKASIEITSRYRGTVAALKHAEGDVVKVGEGLADIRLPAGVAAPPGSVVVVEEEKGQVEVVIGEQQQQQQQQQQEQAGTLASAAAAAPPAAAAAAVTTPEVLAPPAVRRLARELGVDLASIAPGTGVGGRLTKDDVQAAHDGRAAGAAAVATPVPTPTPTPTPTPLPASSSSSSSPAAPFERIPIRGYARTMLRTSTEALSVPMFYYFDEVRVDALARLRADLAGDPALASAAAAAAASASSSSSSAPLKLTFLPFIIKALSVALTQHPAANASLDLGGTAAGAGAGGDSSSSSSSSPQPPPPLPPPSVVRFREHNVGVAMATPGGLIVPCIKNVEQKTVAEVAAELALLQRMAAEGRVPPEKLTGGTITVSNIGALGGTHATPLAHPPQAAIVALGRARALPRFAADSSSSSSGPLEVERHLLMDVSWGADHRVVDGAEVARLSNCWRALLEEPSRLLLHMR
jgi:2-oxoisovalerate dehydrogenase E2 component (dihydrolipoyl transacylase)